MLNRTFGRVGGLTLAALGFVFVIGFQLSKPAPALAQEFDINTVFSCGPGAPMGKQTQEQCQTTKDTILATCTSCHSFVPIVKAQKNEAAWRATLSTHRTRVESLSDEQVGQIQQFLAAHFNDKRPAPVLPPELEAMGGLPPA